jgi:hypothetical protein
MRISRTPIVLAAAALALLAASASTARAGMDVDFGATVRAGDHSDLFLHISARYFDRDRPTLEAWGHRFASPDDLAVFVFLVNRSGKSPDLIFSLRKEGNSWFDVGAQIGLPPDVWFLPVAKDPGPPYGNAYGRWRKAKKRSRNPAFTLSDVDTRNLIAVRMIHEYYGISVEAAMEMRASGRDVRVLTVNEYRSRHGDRMEAGKPKSDAD